MVWTARDIVNRTQGEEFNNGTIIPSASFIYTHCEYCGCEIIQVTDNSRSSYYGYLGNQAEIANNYLASPSVEAMRKFYDVGWEEYHVERRSNGLSFTQQKGNNLYNVHSRLHVKQKGKRGLVHPWNYARGDFCKILCNDCFKKTYKRLSIDVRDGLTFEVTVLPHEDLGEVIEESGIMYLDPKTGRDPLVSYVDDSFKRAEE